MYIKKCFFKTKKFLGENKLFLLQLGLLMLPAALGHASTVSTGLPVDKGLTVIKSAMTGAIPQTAVTVAAASGAIGWAANMDNQIMQKGARLVCGGSLAVAAPSFVSAITDVTTTSGCLFM